MSSSSSSLFSFKPSVADIKVKEVKKEIEDAKNEEKYLQIKLDQIDDKIKIEKSKIDADNKLLKEIEEDRQMNLGSLKSISTNISSLQSRYQHLLSIPGSFKSQEAKPSKSEGDLLMELAPAPKNPSPPPSPGLTSQKVTHVEATAGNRMFWKEIHNIVMNSNLKVILYLLNILLGLGIFRFLQKVVTVKLCLFVRVIRKSGIFSGINTTNQIHMCVRLS